MPVRKSGLSFRGNEQKEKSAPTYMLDLKPENNKKKMSTPFLDFSLQEAQLLSDSSAMSDARDLSRITSSSWLNWKGGDGASSCLIPRFDTTNIKQDGSELMSSNVCQNSTTLKEQQGSEINEADKRMFSPIGSQFSKKENSSNSPSDRPSSRNYFDLLDICANRTRGESSAYMGFMSPTTSPSKNGTSVPRFQDRDFLLENMLQGNFKTGEVSPRSGGQWNSETMLSPMLTSKNTLNYNGISAPTACQSSSNIWSPLKNGLHPISPTAHINFNGGFYGKDVEKKETLEISEDQINRIIQEDLMKKIEKERRIREQKADTLAHQFSFLSYRPRVESSCEGCLHDMNYEFGLQGLRGLFSHPPPVILVPIAQQGILMKPKNIPRTIRPRRQSCCSFCYGTYKDEAIRNGDQLKSKDDLGPWSTHSLKENDIVTCPKLRRQTCDICEATGDVAHTTKYHREHPEQCNVNRRN